MNKTIFILSVFALLTTACTRNVEGLPEVNCDPEPQLHVIEWKMNVSGALASVTVKPGDTVRWVWAEDDMPHDVSSTDSNAPTDFGSEILTGLGTVYEYTFTEEISFDYRCSVHPDTMFGTITVQECMEEE